MAFRIANFTDYLIDRKRRLDHWRVTSPLALEAAYDKITKEGIEVLFDARNVPINFDRQDIAYLYHFPPSHWSAALAARYNQLIFDYDIYSKQNYIVGELCKHMGITVDQLPELQNDPKRDEKLIAAMNQANKYLADPRNRQGLRDRRVFFRAINLLMQFTDADKPLHVKTDPNQMVYQESWAVNPAIRNVMFYRLLEQEGFDPKVWSLVRINLGGRGRKAKHLTTKDQKMMQSQRWFFVKANMGELYERLTKAVLDAQIQQYDTSVESRRKYLRKHGTFGMNLSAPAAAYVETGKTPETPEEESSILNWKETPRVGAGYLGMSQHTAGNAISMWCRSVSSGWYFTDDPHVYVIAHANDKPGRKMRFWNEKTKTWGPLKANEQLQATTYPETDTHASVPVQGGDWMSIGLARRITQDWRDNTEYQRVENTAFRQEQGVDSVKKEVSFGGGKPPYEPETYHSSVIGTQEQVPQAARTDTRPRYLCLSEDGMKKINDALNAGRKDAIRAYFTALESASKIFNTPVPSINPIDTHGKMFTYGALMLGSSQHYINPVTKQQSKVAKDQAIDTHIAVDMLEYGYDPRTHERSFPYLQYKQDASGVTSFIVQRQSEPTSTEYEQNPDTGQRVAQPKVPFATPLLVPSATTDSRMDREWRANLRMGNFLQELQQKNRPELTSRLHSLLTTPDALEKMIETSQQQVRALRERLQVIAENRRASKRRKEKPNTTELQEANRIRDQLKGYGDRMRVANELLQIRERHVKHYMKIARSQGRSISPQQITKLLTRLAPQYMAKATEAQQQAPLWTDYDHLFGTSHSGYASFYGVRKGRGTVQLMHGDKTKIGGDPRLWEVIRPHIGWHGNPTFAFNMPVERLEEGKAATSRLSHDYPVEPYVNMSDEEVMEAIQYLKEMLANTREPRMQIAIKKKIKTLTGFSPGQLVQDMQDQSNRLAEVMKMMRAKAIQYTQNVQNYITTYLEPRLQSLQSRADVAGHAVDDAIMKVKQAIQMWRDDIATGSTSLLLARDTTANQIMAYQRRLELLEPAEGEQLQLGSTQEANLLTALATEAKQGMEQLQTLYRQVMGIEMPAWQPPKKPEARRGERRSKKPQQEEQYEWKKELLRLIVEANEAKKKKAKKEQSINLDFTDEERQAQSELRRMSQALDKLANIALKLLTQYNTSIDLKAKRGNASYFANREFWRNGPLIGTIKRILKKKEEEGDKEAAAMEEKFDAVVESCVRQIERNLGLSAFPRFAKAMALPGNTPEQRREKLLAGMDAWFEVQRITKNFVTSIKQQDLTGRGTRRQRESGAGPSDVPERKYRSQLNEIVDLQRRADLIISGTTGHAASEVASGWRRGEQAASAKAQQIEQLRALREQLNQAQGQWDQIVTEVHSDAEQTREVVEDNVHDVQIGDIEIVKDNFYRSTCGQIAETNKLIQFWATYFEMCGFHRKEARVIAKHMYHDRRFNPMKHMREQLDQYIEKLEQNQDPSQLPPLGAMMGKMQFDPRKLRREQVIRVMKQTGYSRQVPTSFNFTKDNPDPQQEAYIHDLLKLWTTLLDWREDARSAPKTPEGKQTKEQIADRIGGELLHLYNLQTASVSAQPEETEELAATKKKQKTPKSNSSAQMHRYINIRLIVDYILRFFTTYDADNRPKTSFHPVFYDFTEAELMIEPSTVPTIMRSVAGQKVGRLMPRAENTAQNAAWLKYLQRPDVKDLMIKKIATCLIFRRHITHLCNSPVIPLTQEKTSGRQYLYDIKSHDKTIGYFMNDKVTNLLISYMQEAKQQYPKCFEPGYESLPLDPKMDKEGRSGCRASAQCSRRDCEYYQKNHQPLPGRKPSDISHNPMDDAIINSYIAKATTSFDPYPVFGDEPSAAPVAPVATAAPTAPATPSAPGPTPVPGPGPGPGPGGTTTPASVPTGTPAPVQTATQPVQQQGGTRPKNKKKTTS